MATSENLAEVIKQSNEALAQTLAGAFQNLRYQRSSTVKLSKFYGCPKKSGDPTLKEWVEDLNSYARQLGLSGEEKVDVAIDHLGGVAKEEILCCPKAEKKDMGKLLSILRRRVGSPETVQTLNCAFYTRSQLENEKLADFSRALIRLYDRMESASTSKGERTALAQLKPGALKEQFIRGTRDTAMKRELRKLAHDEPDLSFFDFRELALKIMRDTDDPTTSPRENSDGTIVVIDKVGVSTRVNKEPDALVKLSEGQKQLNTLMERLLQQQIETNSNIQKMTQVIGNLKSSGPENAAGYRGPDRQPRNPIRCGFCGKMGHSTGECWSRKAAERAQNNLEVNNASPSERKLDTKSNTKMSGNGTPPQ